MWHELKVGSRQEFTLWAAVAGGGFLGEFLPPEEESSGSRKEALPSCSCTSGDTKGLMIGASLPFGTYIWSQ